MTGRTYRAAGSRWYAHCAAAWVVGGIPALNEAEWAHAERLAEMLLEQLESLRLSEHAEATILTAVARRLVRRTVELGEVIESEARELNDLSALQMATAIQALGPAIDRTLEHLAEDGRFGLMPAAAADPPATAPAAAARGSDRRQTYRRRLARCVRCRPAARTTRRAGYLAAESCAAGKRRHHLAGEDPKLLLELGRRHPLGPVDQHLVQAGVRLLVLAQPVHDLRRRPAQPRLLLPRRRGSSGRRSGRRACPTAGPARRRSARSRTARTTCTARRGTARPGGSPPPGCRRCTGRARAPGPRRAEAGARPSRRRRGTPS